MPILGRKKTKFIGYLSSAEDAIYSHLYRFFSRYYDSGDFISMRRYKEGGYAIPYEGEEVVLHWANKDQYYIKTSENLRKEEDTWKVRLTEEEFMQREAAKHCCFMSTCFSISII